MTQCPKMSLRNNDTSPKSFQGIYPPIYIRVLKVFLIKVFFKQLKNPNCYCKNTDRDLAISDPHRVKRT